MRLSAKHPEDFFALSRPATVKLPPALTGGYVVMKGQTTNPWAPEDFAVLASSSPRVAKYLATKATTRTCVDDMFKKLDPDHRAGAYDVVTFDAKGNVKDVQSLSAKLWKKVGPACKVSALWKERDAVRVELAKQLKSMQDKLLAAIAARFKR